MAEKLKTYLKILYTEDVEMYAPGGYHPVLIGDIYHDRYRIVHKLGHGGFSTVWLARDEQKKQYVALKILVASCKSSELLIFRHLLASQDPRRHHIPSLFDAFVINGPNGSHQCLVTEVAGPNLQDVLEHQKPSLTVAKQIASQIIDGLAFLHSCHIGHGDFHPRNIVIGTLNIADWSVEKVYSTLGNPDLIPVQRIDGMPLTPAAPSYLVQSVSFWNRLQGRGFHVKIVDFGESFFESQPPQRLGTSLTYAAPEVLLGDNITSSVDLWALACTLYVTLGSCDLHYSFFGSVNEVLMQFMTLYGKFPDKLWSSWQHRLNYYEEDGTPKNVLTNLSLTLKACLASMRSEDAEGQTEIDLHLEELEGLFKRLLKYEPECRLRASDVVLPF